MSVILPAPIQISPKEMIRFIETVNTTGGLNLSVYAQSSLSRRISYLLSHYGVDINQLISMMEDVQGFTIDVINNLTVNTTEFFRDIHIWEKILSILRVKLAHQKLNIWVAGCSTGEEVYSLLLLLKKLDRIDDVSIIASDVNMSVLRSAQTGVFKMAVTKTLNSSYAALFGDTGDTFDTCYTMLDHGSKIKMNKELNQNTQYKKHNLCSLKPVSAEPFDIIICRNVLIYIQVLHQLKIIDMFGGCLRTNGYLLLGKDEMILGDTKTNYELFEGVYIKR